jgi:ABC-type transporter Mla maintaining outer membrane lipid asymmetry ATPase subunit MlaF
VILTGVTTVLDDTPVLLRLGLRVPPGGLVAVIGPSGSGKTTLVRHLAGVLAPGAGRVEIGGRDLYGLPDEQRRDLQRRAGVLLGGSSLFESSLFASETATGNVRRGFSGSAVPARRQDRAVARQLAELGLAAWADVLPAAMPAHARRRVGLARALVADPPLLVLDEIETGLDTLTAPAVLAALRARRGCSTIVLTTHDLDLARALDAELAVLCHGRITARGPAPSLLHAVADSGELDERFRASDVAGPPRMEEALREIDGDDTEPRAWHVDQRLAWTAAAALVLVVAFLALRLALRHP